jgi:Protein of unknown function (DUF4038)
MNSQTTITNRHDTEIAPVRVSANGRYFVDRQGQPFFWLGDTQWQLFRDYRRLPPKPVVMAEGAYEEGLEYGFPVTPLMIRRQAY